MGNTVNDRELILEILLAVTRDGEYSHIAFGMCWRITSIWTNRSGHLLRE